MAENSPNDLKNAQAIGKILADTVLQHQLTLAAQLDGAFSEIPNLNALFGAELEKRTAAIHDLSQIGAALEPLVSVAGTIGSQLTESVSVLARAMDQASGVFALPEHFSQSISQTIDDAQATTRDLFGQFDPAQLNTLLAGQLDAIQSIGTLLRERLPELERWSAELDNRVLGDRIDRLLNKTKAPEAFVEPQSVEACAAEAEAVVAAARTPEEHYIARAVAIVVLHWLAEKGLDEAYTKMPQVLSLLFTLLTAPFSTPTPLPEIAPPPVMLVAPALPDGPPNVLDTWQAHGLPETIRRAGPKATARTLEFFAAEIRNPNTRMAYMRAVNQFLNWCEDRSVALEDISPFVVAAYVEEMQRDFSAPTVKQHLAAIRMLFDYLVVGQVLPMNPASSVRGPKHVVKRGKTSVLTADQARLLLDSIDTEDVIGLRDRALIGVMVYSFARVSAAIGMNAEDYFPSGKRWWFRLHEKGGKRHEVPVHHNAEQYLDEYLEAAGIGEEKKAPLFRTAGRNRKLTENRMHRLDVLRMIYRRAKAAGLDVHACCHTFRATGITAYLENGGTIEKAQQIAAHESPKTTKLYDRTNDELTLDEIERIVI